MIDDKNNKGAIYMAGCGCCGTVYLTEKESELLSLFAEYSFLPVGQRDEDAYPRILGEDAEEGNALLMLKLKGLVDIDYDRPLSGFDYAPFTEYYRLGSAALTKKGQDVIETIEIVGVG